MRDDGWLRPAPNPASDRSPANSSRKRYLLTPKGAREAKMALQKQGTQVGGQWQLNEGEVIPVPAQQRIRPSVHAAVQRFGSEPLPVAPPHRRQRIAGSVARRDMGANGTSAPQQDGLVAHA
jgi:hypothetical protein